ESAPEFPKLSQAEPGELRAPPTVHRVAAPDRKTRLYLCLTRPSCADDRLRPARARETSHRPRCYRDGNPDRPVDRDVRGRSFHMRWRPTVPRRRLFRSLRYLPERPENRLPKSAHEEVYSGHSESLALPPPAFPRLLRYGHGPTTRTMFFPAAQM